MSVGSFALAVVAGRDALHTTGFFAGGALLAGASVARSHARATWLEAVRAGRYADATARPTPDR